MAGRVFRLTRVELTKLVLHPFFPIALLILATLTLLGAWAFEPKTTVWSGPHALLLFALGAKAGLKIAMFLLVIFGSLSFAGEFDKGTVRLLLTRPVTRTELFIAKSLTGLALAAFYFAVVMAISFGFGCLRGDLGPVWDGEQGLILSSADGISAHAAKAVKMSIAGVLAAVFLGIAVSTFVESSGFAVAIALTIFIGADLGLGLVREEQSRYLFSWYPAYAFETLRSFAEGSSTLWRPAAESPVSLKLFRLPTPWLWIPAVSALVCSGVGYVMFRIKNILA
ncbi:MAG TPA: ABC transporter permease [Planctomycetota bacterium]|nr:ABC transporter permease [Planctomycetota bacterium]